MEAKDLHGRHYFTITLTSQKCEGLLIASRYCCHHLAFSTSLPPFAISALISHSFLSINHFSISSLPSIPLPAGKCLATPVSLYHNFWLSSILAVILMKSLSELELASKWLDEYPSKKSSINIEWMILWVLFTWVS